MPEWGIWIKRGHDIDYQSNYLYLSDHWLSIWLIAIFNCSLLNSMKCNFCGIIIYCWNNAPCLSVSSHSCPHSLHSICIQLKSSAKKKEILTSFTEIIRNYLTWRFFEKSFKSCQEKQRQRQRQRQRQKICSGVFNIYVLGEYLLHLFVRVVKRLFGFLSSSSFFFLLVLASLLL